MPDSTIPCARLDSPISAAMVLLGLSLGSGACSDGPLDQRAEIPLEPAEGEGIQFVQPETIIPAAEERMVCWVPEWTPEQDYFVASFSGYQGSMGHHVVAFRSATPREPGSTFDCTDQEQMATLRPLILPDLGKAQVQTRSAAADGGPGVSALPPGYAVRMAAGTQLVMQSHYVNYGEEDIVISDVARFMFAPAEQVLSEVGYLMLNHNLVDVPPGQSTLSRDCVTKDDYNLLLLFGHMHEAGSSIRITRDSGQGVEELYAVDDWTAEFRDEPPVLQWAPDQALALNAGDTLGVECNYDNRADGPLRFPSEMCVSIAYYFPVKEGSDPLVLCGDEDDQ